MATYAGAASAVSPGDTDSVMSGGEGDQGNRRSESRNSSLAPPPKVFNSPIVLKRTKASKATGFRPDGAVPVSIATSAEPSTPSFNWADDKETEVQRKAKSAERKKAQKQKDAAVPAPPGVGGKRPHSDSPIKPDLPKRTASNLREESRSGSPQGPPESTRRRKNRLEMTKERALNNQGSRMKKLSRDAAKASLEPSPAQHAAGTKKPPSAVALGDESTSS